MSENPARVTVTAFGVTDPGKVRKNNEDAYLITHLAQLEEAVVPTEVVPLEATEHAVLLAVSDGMGGANAGEVASALVVQSLREAMLEAKGSWDEVTRAAVERVNREVYAAAKEPGKKGMGATLTAVCVHGDQAFIAEVGDSRAYLVRNGRIRQVTRDQSFVQLLVDSGALKPEEAEKYPMKNVVLQAMGQSNDVKVAIGKLTLRRGDRLLLCSDGLSNKVPAGDMLQMMLRAKTIDVACTELVAFANARGGDDNITVVIAEIDGDSLEIPRDQETLTQTFQVITEYKAAGSDLDGEDDDETVRDVIDEDEPTAQVPVKTAPAAPAAKPIAAPAAPAKGLPPVVIALIAALAFAAIYLFATNR